MSDRILIGDKVTWESQSGGVTRTKTGVVAARVPQHDYPIAAFTRGIRTAQKLDESYARRVAQRAKSAFGFALEDLSFKPLSDGGGRSETSFLVVAENGGVYWPRTSLLQKTQ